MLRHQYRGDSSHRIVQLDAAGFLKQAGEWARYQSIATFSGAVTGTKQKLYVAVTPYFEGGAIKPDRIYEAAPLSAAHDGGSEWPGDSVLQRLRP